VLDQHPSASSEVEGAVGVGAHPAPSRADLPSDYHEALQEIGHLRAALTNRTVVATALGILVERNRWTSEQAFSWMVNLSQHTNVRLVTLARDIVTEATARADP
jgi:hypothetical protein